MHPLEVRRVAPRQFVLARQLLKCVFTEGRCSFRQARGGSAQVVAGPYDAVVVAAPLEHSAIRFRGVGVRAPPEREFRKVTTTFVAGRLKAACWNVTVLPTGAPQPAPDLPGPDLCCRRSCVWRCCAALQALGTLRATAVRLVRAGRH